LREVGVVGDIGPSVVAERFEAHMGGVCWITLQQQRYWWGFHDREEGRELVASGREGAGKGEGTRATSRRGAN
jgi:hypothetical protein